VYPDWENEAILEIELTSEDQNINIPNWLSVIKEVTGDENYSNAKLAK
jgi:CYTH domain-containing protein